MAECTFCKEDHGDQEDCGCFDNANNKCICCGRVLVAKHTPPTEEAPKDKK